MTEIRERADFSFIRYAQCWEDADILLEALDIQPTHTCLAVASAGDNALAMLSCSPKRVIAVDLSCAQLACLELRVAAYRVLDYDEMLRLMGSQPGSDRTALYSRCRPLLSAAVRRFWDQHRRDVERGIGGAGKFEHYLRMFRTRALPLIHGKTQVAQLFAAKSSAERLDFYNNVWSNRRWRLMLKVFCSQTVMGRLGRAASFFQYVDSDVSQHISKRVEHALTVLDPTDNPYLQWIFFGRHTSSLPFALRRENFARIRENLDRLEWYQQSVDDFVRSDGAGPIDRFNLSDIFEYMSPESYEVALKNILAVATPQARLVYWNMLVPRSRPEELRHRMCSLSAMADALHRRDKTFFYNALVVEEVRAA